MALVSDQQRQDPKKGVGTAHVSAYFDYVCPYAWRGMELAEMVAEPLGLRFAWHHFSLYQHNYEGEETWHLWNEPLTTGAHDGEKGLLPFLASCAARVQGEESHHRFRLALMRTHHRDGKPYTGETCLEAARLAGLDIRAFEEHLADPSMRRTLERDHQQAASLKVRGTPTFHFAGGDLAYFRLSALPETVDQGVDLFRRYRDLLEGYPYLETIRRPI